MRLRRLPILCMMVALIGGLAAPQEAIDREAYARDYVRFLALQLNQYSKEFPQQFNAAVMKPPVDSTKLSEAAKASAAELGASIEKLSSLAKVQDVMTNAGFRAQLDKALSSAKELNQVMASQRFPTNLQSDWDQVRSNLNNLARIYKRESLAFLEPPGAGPGGRGRPAVAAAGAGVTGYIVDVKCSKQGKGMLTNVQCIERCVRDGDKLVLVTEEGKIYQIANQDKITSDTYGQVVTLIGKTDGETITIESIKI